MIRRSLLALPLLLCAQFAVGPNLDLASGQAGGGGGAPTGGNWNISKPDPVDSIVTGAGSPLNIRVEQTGGKDGAAEVCLYDADGNEVSCTTLEKNEAQIFGVPEGHSLTVEKVAVDNDRASGNWSNV